MYTSEKLWIINEAHFVVINGLWRHKGTAGDHLVAHLLQTVEDVDHAAAWTQTLAPQHETSDLLNSNLRHFSSFVSGYTPHLSPENRRQEVTNIATEVTKITKPTWLLIWIWLIESGNIFSLLESWTVTMKGILGLNLMCFNWEDWRIFECFLWRNRIRNKKLLYEMINKRILVKAFEIFCCFAWNKSFLTVNIE